MTKSEELMKMPQEPVRMCQEPILVSLENYDLTRKVFAVDTMDVLNRLINAEAAKATPDLTAIANLAAAMAELLAAVS